MDRNRTHMTLTWGKALSGLIRSNLLARYLLLRLPNWTSSMGKSFGRKEVAGIARSEKARALVMGGYH